MADVVEKIDKNAQQIREVIEAGTGIIITILQKFPVIYKEVRSGRGSRIFLLSAISNCLEILLGTPISSKINLRFDNSKDFNMCNTWWKPCVKNLCCFLNN